MRVVQLIDSLEAGGAERMAVNYANALADEIAFSALVTTRKEGILKKQISNKTNYLFLNKKSKVDIKAVFKLRKYLLKNKVQIIQAHSSSFFLAVLVKLSLPRVKIIWHDHYGNSEFLEKRPKAFLLLAKYFFSGIIAVNEKLKTWSHEQLHFKNVIYLPNFALIEKGVGYQQTILAGQVGKRIVCLANLRPQKNHFLLTAVASMLKESHPEWSFHLIGKNFQDSHAHRLKENIKQQQLENHVFLYDSCSDIAGVLEQVQIGILTSDSEGLPVALLEYGLHKKAVVLTDVGQVAAVIENNNNGFLVPSNDVMLFYNRLVELIENETLQETFAKQLHEKVMKHFSSKAVIGKYQHWIRTTITNE
ncbi:Glycosyltransferase involved in cell wall bisynthesis [Flavobacterium flevense]|uniref:Glycosyl transferase n=1 Tax=Flavobacterium flevense TaxID=983 RepID=A0A4Y4B2W8_9FLAO|nr:glycosyltransferase [Flavobacterium flevense]GEC73457.1 glycosyl transferase [Flavobacterium flevense]SHM00245.1 Glycosyltransferase involved in cell wall bisynthesis [Flavobacterium flevense]